MASQVEQEAPETKKLWNKTFKSNISYQFWQTKEKGVKNEKKNQKNCKLHLDFYFRFNSPYVYWLYEHCVGFVAW